MAPEGRFPVLISIVIAAVLSWWWGFQASVIWLLPIVLLWVYRHPKRVIPATPLGVISPIDGEVVAIDSVQDSYLSREATRIRIKPALLDSFVVHSVSEGKVMQFWRGAGDDASPEEQHRRAVWLQSDEGDDVVIIMQARPANPLHCRVSTGERIGQGHECGFLLFPRYLDVLLPVDSRIDVQLGDRVRGGESIIAQLIHR
jgi:phosphatidylserine decarboxylase